jgi:hypothetical protein
MTREPSFEVGFGTPHSACCRVARRSPNKGDTLAMSSMRNALQQLHARGRKSGHSAGLDLKAAMAGRREVHGETKNGGCCACSLGYDD